MKTLFSVACVSMLWSTSLEAMQPSSPSLDDLAQRFARLPPFAYSSSEKGTAKEVTAIRKNCRDSFETATELELRRRISILYSALNRSALEIPNNGLQQGDQLYKYVLRNRPKIALLGLTFDDLERDYLGHWDTEKKTAASQVHPHIRDLPREYYIRKLVEAGAASLTAENSEEIYQKNPDNKGKPLSILYISSLLKKEGRSPQAVVHLALLAMHFCPDKTIAPYILRYSSIPENDPYRAQRKQLIQKVLERNKLVALFQQGWEWGSPFRDRFPKGFVMYPVKGHDPDEGGGGAEDAAADSGPGTIEEATKVVQPGFSEKEKNAFKAGVVTGSAGTTTGFAVVDKANKAFNKAAAAGANPAAQGADNLEQFPILRITRPEGINEVAIRAFFQSQGVVGRQWNVNGNEMTMIIQQPLPENFAPAFVAQFPDCTLE